LTSRSTRPELRRAISGYRANIGELDHDVLPDFELVAAGVHDLERGVVSREALLVSLSS
jgi:hypothetical protein